MKQNTRSSGSEGSRIFGRFAANKKKVIIAACLFAIMILMWVRVLLRSGPQSAEAAVTAQEVADSQTSTALKISFIELPKVKGRNDVLTRDFFVVDDWRDFMKSGAGNSGGMGEVSVVSGNGGEETIRRVAGKLKLEAIALGENPLAVINDTRLSAGDKLSVGDGTNTYECEVAKIEENIVVIRCGEAEITLRLTQTPILDY